MSVKHHGVFGFQSNSISSYSLINTYLCSEKELDEIVHAAGGFYIDLNDGENHGVAFNLTVDQMILVARSIGCSAFIYGKDETPSNPVYYVLSDDVFSSKELNESISEMDELEVIAAKCNELWQDLFFNDYFRECLFSTIGLV